MDGNRILKGAKMEKFKIHYTKDGWVCERYPYDFPIEDEARFIEVDEDQHRKTLETNPHHAWRVVKGKLKEERYEETPEQEVLEELRSLREEICFPIINRGQLWHERLTAEQKSELVKWYDDWLNVTETKTPPPNPRWFFYTQEDEVKEKENCEDGTTTNQDTTAHEPPPCSADGE